ncbi:MAG TPA: hypothetical protein VMY59_09765 [Candidatus Thermoplasmatota archaeon]|nr:hypothetical protein [Candidatus Thermoplasmatota archaeon]
MYDTKERWYGKMVCPLYVDFTRGCIKKFPSFIKFVTFKTCESEQYVDCLMYQVCTSSFNCEYLIRCSNQYNEKIPKFTMTLLMNKEAGKVITDIQKKYCLSPEISKTCARYSLLSKGEIPPVNLMPNGQKISPLDLILKRKLIAPPPE